MKIVHVAKFECECSSTYITMRNKLEEHMIESCRVTGEGEDIQRYENMGIRVYGSWDKKSGVHWVFNIYP